MIICQCGHKEDDHDIESGTGCLMWTGGPVAAAYGEDCPCERFEPAPEDEQPGYSMAVDRRIDEMKEERHHGRG